MEKFSADSSDPEQFSAIPEESYEEDAYAAAHFFHTT